MRTVEIRCKINGVIADFLEQGLVGNRRQTGFRVAHRRRRVVVDGSEIAVTIEQWMAAGEGLHQTHQGVVDRLIPMGVVLAKHVPDNAGTLAVGPIRGEPELLHRIQDSALHGLETIQGIGQGSTHDHAHRVFEVGTLHLLMQGDRLNALLSHSVR